MAEREGVFGAFMTDPEWQKIRAETEKNGPIVTSISTSLLAPTAYFDAEVNDTRGLAVTSGSAGHLAVTRQVSGVRRDPCRTWSSNWTVERGR